jgi:hypothetical protein
MMADEQYNKYSHHSRENIPIAQLQEVHTNTRGKYPRYYSEDMYQSVILNKEKNENIIDPVTGDNKNIIFSSSPYPFVIKVKGGDCIYNFHIDKHIAGKYFIDPSNTLIEEFTIPDHELISAESFREIFTYLYSRFHWWSTPYKITNITESLIYIVHTYKLDFLKDECKNYYMTLENPFKKLKYIQKYHNRSDNIELTTLCRDIYNSTSEQRNIWLTECNSSNLFDFLSIIPSYLLSSIICDIMIRKDEIRDTVKKELKDEIKNQIKDELIIRVNQE